MAPKTRTTRTVTGLLWKVPTVLMFAVLMTVFQPPRTTLLGVAGFFSFILAGFIVLLIASYKDEVAAEDAAAKK